MSDKFVMEVLKTIAEEDLYGELLWQTRGEYAPITFFIDCSDIFWWGTADFERLTPQDLDNFKQAIRDVREVTGGDNSYGPDLYCARRRGERPQGAAYPKDKRLWPLFDACGPKKNIQLGNPYEPGCYQR